MKSVKKMIAPRTSDEVQVVNESRVALGAKLLLTCSDLQRPIELSLLLRLVGMLHNLLGTLIPLSLLDLQALPIERLLAQQACDGAQDQARPHGRDAAVQAYRHVGERVDIDRALRTVRRSDPHADRCTKIDPWANRDSPIRQAVRKAARRKQEEQLRKCRASEDAGDVVDDSQVDTDAVQKRAKGRCKDAESNDAEVIHGERLSLRSFLVDVRLVDVERQHRRDADQLRRYGARAAHEH